MCVGSGSNKKKINKKMKYFLGIYINKEKRIKSDKLNKKNEEEFPFCSNLMNPRIISWLSSLVLLVVVVVGGELKFSIPNKPKKTTNYQRSSTSCFVCYLNIWIFKQKQMDEQTQIEKLKSSKVEIVVFWIELNCEWAK